MAACRPKENGDHEELREGKARILKKGNDVFYNEAQVSCKCLWLLHNMSGCWRTAQLHCGPQQPYKRPFNVSKP